MVIKAGKLRMIRPGTSYNRILIKSSLWVLDESGSYCRPDLNRMAVEKFPDRLHDRQLGVYRWKEREEWIQNQRIRMNGDDYFQVIKEVKLEPYVVSGGTRKYIHGQGYVTTPEIKETKGWLCLDAGRGKFIVSHREIKEMSRPAENKKTAECKRRRSELRADIKKTLEASVDCQHNAKHYALQSRLHREKWIRQEKELEELERELKCLKKKK